MSRELDLSLYGEASDPLRYAKSVDRTTRFLDATLGLNITGAEHVPQEGAALLAFVHRSQIDPWVIGASTPRAIVGLGKVELDEKWYYRRTGATSYLRKRDMLFINREKTTKSQAANVRSALRQDRLVALAPEATSKNKGPKVGTLFQGVGRFALMSGRRDETTGEVIYPPIVPVSMTTEHWWKGGPIHTIYGGPMVPGVDIDLTEARSNQDRAELILEVVGVAMQDVHNQALELASTE
jgi:1-acyl-sn-glycerol-3-phosphate acyltransferase